MSNQHRQLKPIGQLSDWQFFRPGWPGYRLGFCLGLVVLGIGRLSHNSAWAFPANLPSETCSKNFSKDFSKISSAQKRPPAWSISRQTFRPPFPTLVQPHYLPRGTAISFTQTVAPSPVQWSTSNLDFDFSRDSLAQATAISGRAKLPPKQPPEPWRQGFRLDNFDLDPALYNEVSTIGDPELGILRLKEQPLPVQKQPVAYLLARVDYLSSDNIFLETDPVNDQFVRTGLSLAAVPTLGPQTSLFASVGGSLLRYSSFTDSDYNDLRFQVGVTQWLFPHTYGQLSWSNQQLFEAAAGDRFFNDHSVQLELGRRDRLLPGLALDSFYQLRFSFSDPNDFSRFIQTLGASLSYNIAPELGIALNYQLTLADFTQQERYDTFNQLFGQVTFNLTSSSRFNLFGGFSFGDSSKAAIGFDDTIFGLSLDVDLPLF